MALIKYALRALLAGLIIALFGSAACGDVLIDNMESGKKNQSLAGGYWFLMIDVTSHEKANTRLVYPKNRNFVFAESGFQSARCARACAILGQGYRAPFVGMGLNLDGSKQWYDFRKVKKIEFKARGKGVWNLKLRDAWNYRQTPNHMNYYWTFTVDSTWRCFSLSPRDLAVPDRSPARGAGLKWKSVADSVGALIFVSSSYKAEDAGVCVDLQIDDIVIRGDGIEEIGWVRNNAPSPCFVDRRTRVDLSGDDDVEMFDDEGILFDLDD